MAIMEIKIKATLSFLSCPRLAIKNNKKKNLKWPQVQIWILEKRKTYSVVVEVQTDIVAKEITVEVPSSKKSINNSTLRFRYRTPERVSKGLRILLQRHLLLHIHWKLGRGHREGLKFKGRVIEWRYI